MCNTVNKHKDAASTRVTIFLHCTPRMLSNESEEAVSHLWSWSKTFLHESHEVLSLSADLLYSSIYISNCFGNGLSLSDIYIDKIIFLFAVSQQCIYHNSCEEWT